MFTASKLIRTFRNKTVLKPLLLIAVGGVVYFNLQWMVDYLVYNLLGLDEDLYFTVALHFFAYH